MTWQTYPGKTYRVQFKNDLNETNWARVGSDAVAGGAALSITNSTSASPQRFYRILQLD